jgi:hypothetical protein
MICAKSQRSLRVVVMALLYGTNPSVLTWNCCPLVAWRVQGAAVGFLDVDGNERPARLWKQIRQKR